MSKFQKYLSIFHQFPFRSWILDTIMLVKIQERRGTLRDYWSFLLLARKVYNSVFKSFMSTSINLFLSILIFLASIPSPTETTSLSPCSCDTPSKDLQSYATSAFSSEEGSTSSLHFSSSSTFRSSFYGSSLYYCRCSTTKSTIYEMRKYIQLRKANNLRSFVTEVNFHW